MKTPFHTIPLLLAFAGTWLLPSLALAQAGTPLWTNRYSLSGNFADQASALAVDLGGNVHTTGYSDVFSLDDDFATVKYSSAGVPVWTNLYNGPWGASGGDDRAHSIAVDTNGNVYVTGDARGAGGSQDYATIKYSSAGTLLWTNLYNGPGNSTDSAAAVAVDAGGDVYVTGSSVGSGGTSDYATIKYSTSGTPLWTNRYNGSANGLDQALALALDTNANVFVTGESVGAGSGGDFLTIAYSSAGVPLWTNRYNGPGNGDDVAVAVAVDGNPNVHVTGYSTGSGSSWDYATIKYSGAGVPLWTNRYNGPGNAGDYAIALAVDRAANVYVTGLSYSGTSDSSADYATIKYSSAGVPLWTNRYNGPGNGFDYAAAVAVDTSGNAYVTGFSDGGSVNYDYATVAYSSAGAAFWTNRYRGPVNGDDRAQAVAVDATGSVYVTGYSVGSAGGYDFATIKYRAQTPSPIPLQIQRVGDQVVLSWANPVFGLQSAPTINGTFTNVPSATSPRTNPITGTPQFFRLKAN